MDEKMDFDMTQVVTQSDTEGEDEENGNSAPVAHIKVLNQQCLKKKLYPIYKGDNTIGRHDLCQVSVPVRSLSKKHACIEVRGRSHFIYDMGSRNRTRRGTHYLTPEVRYELRNNDMVVFADVSCIYLIEDSARASDSGSETDPMSDSETVFHTVAVNMYNPGTPSGNRAVEPELIEVAVASDPNSCDSAASSDILLPTQDFTVSKIKQESQNQTDAVQGSESLVIKNSRKEEAIKFLVADSDSEDEHENLSKELRFQNNGNHEDSLDMDLLAAATQAYVADSEDDDNKSEILDMVHTELFVADTQSDDSPKPPSMDKINRNGSTSPSSPIITSFATNSPRTYSKKDASNKNGPTTVLSKSIDTTKDKDKTVEEEFEEETQDPNLFAMSTLIADENNLNSSPGNRSPLPSPKSDKNATLNTTIEEADTVPVTADDRDTVPVDDDVATIPVDDDVATIPVNDDVATIPVNDDVVTIPDNDDVATIPVEDDVATIPVRDVATIPVNDDVATIPVDDDVATIPVDDDVATIPLDNEVATIPVNDKVATLPVNNEEAATVPISKDVVTSDNLTDTEEGASDQAATVILADTIPVSSQNEVIVSSTKDDIVNLPIAKDDDSANPILNETATLVVSGEDVATVQVTTDEIMFVGMNVDVRGTDTVEVDPLPEESPKEKQSKADNSGVEPPLILVEESDSTEAKSIVDTPSKELSSSSASRFIPDGEASAESKKSPHPEAEKKESLLNTKSKLLDVPALCTPSTKDKSPKMSERSDDEALDATQPYTTDCLDDFSPVRRDTVKAKKSLPFSTDNMNVNDSDLEEDTQPYVLDDNPVNNKEGSQSPAPLTRGGEHEISDEEEDSVETSEKRKFFKKVTSSQGEDANNTGKVETKSEGSQTVRSTLSRCRVKKVTANKDAKEATSAETVAPSLKVEQTIQDTKSEAEPSKTEESLSENKEKLVNQSEESSNLDNGEMTETATPTKMNSEAACSSLLATPIVLIERRMTRRGSKDSEESCEIPVKKAGRRTRKRKSSEEKESTKNTTPTAGQSSKTNSNVIAEAKADDKEEETSPNGKKARRSVHFVGVSSSEEDLEEAIKTLAPRTRRSQNVGQESEVKAVGKKKRGRATKAEKGAEMINTADSAESTTKGRRLRGRKSKDDDNNQKDSQTTGNTENDKSVEITVNINQRQTKRTRASTVLDESSEVNSSLDNSTKGKKSRGRKQKASNQKKEEFETLGNEEMAVDAEPSEEMPILQKEMKEVKLEILDKSSEVTSGATVTLEEEVPEREAEDETTKDDASKSSPQKVEVKTEKISENEIPAKRTEDKVKEDSPKVRSSRANRSKKSIDDDDKSQKSVDENDGSQKSVDENDRSQKSVYENDGSQKSVEENDGSQKSINESDKSQKSVDEDARSQKSVDEESRSLKSADENEKEENINTDTKNKVTKVSSNKRVSRASRSKTTSDATVLEDGEMVPEKDSSTEPTPRGKRGRPAKTGKTNSQESGIALEEPPANVRASRSTRRTSQEEKVPEDTCTTTRRSRSERAKKVKDQDGEGDAVEVTAKDKASKRQTRKNSEESADKNEVVGTRKGGRQKSKNSKNSNKDNETIVKDEKDHDDNDDFVAPLTRGPSSERKAVSQEGASSPSSQRNSSVSSDSETAKVVKQEPKTPTSRKRNPSSQSSSQSSPLTTPRRNSSFSPGTPSSRSSSISSKPKVMFTGVADDKLQKIVTDLGGSVVTSFDNCTHLVTDKIRRTVKFLCCLARGIPIVSPSWLTNCKSAKMFIDHISHLVSDPATEKQYKFTLKNSLQQARNGPLLENYKIHVTKSVKPNVDQMKEIMNSCKAQYLKRMPNEEEEKTIVISCEEDRTLCQPALNAGIPIVNAEFILTGILQYDISVSKYQIFDSSSGNKRKPSETDKGNATAKRRRR